MRIGLFTIFRCVNYGAVLQALALKYVLTHQFPNATIEVINHFMDPRDNHLLGKITNPNTPWFQRWRNKWKFQKRFYRSDLFEVRREKTIQLIDSVLQPTKHLFKSPSELAGLPPYDVVVVGSDQVWNPELNHDFAINQYLCTTLPEQQRRVSYAASFGVGVLPDEVKPMYRAALSKFSMITVREETGAKICEMLLGSRPPVVLDPTMLLDAADWRELIASLRSEPIADAGNYLFAYWVRTPIQADIDALAVYAQQAGMPIRLTVAGQLPKLNFPATVLPQVDADPIDLVRLLDASAGVITDSFHGLQFSVNLSKPVLALGELSSPHSKASRLVDFCSRCGLTGACAELCDFRSGNLIPLSPPATGDILREGRAFSIACLKEMIQL